MKEQTLVALAEYMETTGAGAIDNDLQQLEVQVSRRLSLHHQPYVMES